MTGGVLVEQRVEEEKAALRDGRGVRHQRDLAEAARAFVASSTFFSTSSPREAFASTMRPAFEADRDAVDQRALVGERLGAGDMAVDPARMRRSEHLLGRDVRDCR